MFFFLVVTRLPVLKFWVIICFYLFYRRVWLGSMLDFLYVSNPRLLDIFESFLTLTIQSSVSFWSVRSGSFSNFDKTLRLISASFADTRPCANIRHLKLSADYSPSLKSSQLLWTTEANPKQSSLSLFVKLRHFHLLWNRDVSELNDSDSNLTVSEKPSSQVFFLFFFFVRYNLRTCCVLWFLAFVEVAGLFFFASVQSAQSVI